MLLAEDREELDPFENRDVGVAGETQHPGVELQPGQFAVEITRLLEELKILCPLRHPPEPTQSVGERTVNIGQPFVPR